MLQISLIDNGIPINEDEAAKLFEPYQTLKSARDINAAGSGLGLFVSRALTREMGGDVKLMRKIKSQVGEKAFVVNVKARQLDAPAPEQEQQVGLESIFVIDNDITKSKILIFEDQAFSQIALESIFYDDLKLRSHVTFFNNGNSIAKAIRSLYKEREANQVALVVIDYLMPGMSGKDLIIWTRDYFEKHNVDRANMPRFSFRANPFWSQSSEVIREIFDMGVEVADVIEKFTSKEQA